MLVEIVKLDNLISVITAGTTITLANTDDFQAISSPHYPGFYPEHLDITFIIYSPEGTNVKLTFLDFSIETDYYYDYSDCNYDQFIIYDGKYIIYFVKNKKETYEY